MAVIRGKIFLDREVVPGELTVGGEWPFKRDSSGKWVSSKDSVAITILNLEELIDSTAVEEEEKTSVG